MRRNKWAILFTILAVLVAACSPDDAEDTTTTTSPPPEVTTTQPPPEGTTTTASPSSTMTTLPPEAFMGYCAFMPNLVWLQDGAIEAGVIDTLADLGITAYPGRLTPEQLADATPGETEGAPAPFDGGLDIITVDAEGQTAADVVVLLRNEEFVASVVNAIGMASHWQFKPGTDAMAADASDLLVPTSTPSESYVAVVDTGIDVADGYAWLYDNLLLDGVDSPDHYDLSGSVPASHGTFIASVIRQVAPTQKVSFASVPITDGSSVVGLGEASISGPGTATITNEYDVLAGIERIIDRHTARELKVSALNLSWGTYPCDLGGDLEDVLALRTAMDLWHAAAEEHDALRGAQVFAAAGNEPNIHGPFYPAAFPDVIGVGAEGDIFPAVVWSDNKPLEDDGSRAWAEATAPGCGIVGVGGDPATPVVSWSGSSFATAIAAAAWAEDNSADPKSPNIGAFPADFQGGC